MAVKCLSWPDLISVITFQADILETTKVTVSWSTLVSKQQKAPEQVIPSQL